MVTADPLAAASEFFNGPLERDLQAPWQAGGEIVVFAAADGSPRAGRRAEPPDDAGQEQACRAEHLALARKLNLVTAYRVVPLACLCPRPRWSCWSASP